jgi:hypothetical protein
MRAAFFVLAMLSAACSDPIGFICCVPSQTMSCGLPAPCSDGRACVDHACAETAPQCTSGLRWDESAGDRAGSCTPAGLEH